MSVCVAATSNSRKTFGCGGNETDADTSSNTLVANPHSKTFTATASPPRMARCTQPHEPWPNTGPRGVDFGATC